MNLGEWAFLQKADIQGWCMDGYLQYEGIVDSNAHLEEFEN